MEKKITYIIEHLEDKPGRWILLEYEHAALHLGNSLLITNFKWNPETIRIPILPRTTPKRVEEIVGDARTIVLDPSARKTLRPEDADKTGYVVVGGILGDHPPRQRTKRLLTPRIPNPLPRNLGDKQMSIDGALITAYLVLEKKTPLEKISFKDGYVMETTVFPGISHKIVLPYRYPVINGRVFFYKKLEKYLRREAVFDENLLIG